MEWVWEIQYIRRVNRGAIHLRLLPLLIHLLFRLHYPSSEKGVSGIMTRLFSEEKLQEIHDINVMQQGEQKGLEKGIQAMVRTLRCLKLSPVTVVESLVDNFGLTKDEAEAKVQAYWGI